MGKLILNGWSVSSSPVYVLKERLNTQMAPGEGQVMDMIKVGSWWDNEEWLSMKASLKVFEFKFQKQSLPTNVTMTKVGWASVWTQML